MLGATLSSRLLTGMVSASPFSRERLKSMAVNSRMRPNILLDRTGGAITLSAEADAKLLILSSTPLGEPVGRLPPRREMLARRGRFLTASH